MNATVSHVSVGGWEAYRLANDRIDVVVIPAKGAEIWSVTDHRTGIDVLWKAPWALRPHAVSTATAGASQTAWLDHYAGGWQVLFPNGGDAVTYRGADLGFHGEASVALDQPAGAGAVLRACGAGEPGPALDAWWSRLAGHWRAAAPVPPRSAPPAPADAAIDLREGVRWTQDAPGDGWAGPGSLALSCLRRSRTRFLASSRCARKRPGSQI